MITIYTRTNHKQCKTALKFLKESGVKFKNKYVNKDPLTIDEIKTIINCAYDHSGTMEDVFAVRSNAYKKMKTQILEKQNTKMSDLYKFIQKNPETLKYPIILDEKRFLSGYDEFKIRQFLPRSTKKAIFSETLKESFDTA